MFWKATVAVFNFLTLFVESAVPTWISEFVF